MTGRAKFWWTLAAVSVIVNGGGAFILNMLFTPADLRESPLNELFTLNGFRELIAGAACN